MENLSEPNKVKLILHPGHDKCGSSFIQSFLYSNRKVLEKAGFYLPDCNFRFSFEDAKRPNDFIWVQPLSYLSEIIYSNQEISLFSSRLRSVLRAAQHYKNCHTIILSSETLKNIQEAKCREIHQILSQSFNDVYIVYYIRKQDNYIISSWQQWRHKLGISLNEYVHECLSNNNPDFLGTINFFVDIYGEKSVKVRLLSTNNLYGGNLAQDFCYHSKINSISNLSLDEEYDKNASLNPYICDILSRVHKIYDLTNPNKNISVIHNQRIKDLLRKHIGTEEILWRSDKKILSDQARNSILKHFTNQNQEIYERYLDSSYEIQEKTIS